MSRLHVRGGPWTNTEDQVLKVALAKNGLMDWERVASMVTGKTAAQCRERWEHYLDPRLNLKEAWSPDEEERLVELQSAFPNQWRLISAELTRSTPAKYIRPAWLCEQHYSEIRDAHEFEKQQAERGAQKERDSMEEDQSAPQTLEEFMRERRQRRMAYQAHEEKAARVDTVDGDRFREEMVTMAVSRLANQDQKKGLRKERERKLEEARFLAKLESNRESIESGTLSARQEKLMRKALEDDRSGRKHSRSDGDDESYGSSGGSDGDGAEDGDSDARRKRAFKPVDVLEDKESAGTHKKARTLVVDLGKQQERITASSVAESSAAAGVNTSLLAQLTAAPAALAIKGAKSSHLLTDNAATTWDSLAGPNAAAPNLDDLFSTLPDVVGTSDNTSGIGVQAKLAAEALPAPPTVQAEPTFNVPPSLPAVRAKTEQPHAEKPLTRPLSPVAAAAAAAEEEEEVTSHWGGAVATSLHGATTAAAAYLAKAKELVAVETERLFVAARRRRPGQQGTGDEDDEEEDDILGAVSPADVALVKDLLEQTIPVRATAVGGAARLARAVSAAQERAQYYTHLNTSVPIRELEPVCVREVNKVNARLAAMEARVAHVAITCFMDPQDTLVRPFVANGEASLPVLRYVKQLWETRLQDAAQQAAFLARLRTKEQVEMTRLLVAAQLELDTLKAKESQLQTLYRQRGEKR